MPNEKFKLFRYRWVVILIFGVCSCNNLAQNNQFTIIGDIVISYYGVTYFQVNMTGLIFLITFILFFIPIGYIVENTVLRKCMIISVGLTVIGTCLKYFAASPQAFYLILISQMLCGISQIFFLITPSKIASVWFGAKEVSTACAIGVFGTELGEGLGSAIPSLMVKHSESNEFIEKDLKLMFGYYALASMICFILVVLLFRSKPPLPPSQSQSDLVNLNVEKMTYYLALKGFARNKDFIIVLFSLGLAFSIWTTSCILLNEIYMNFFPEDESGWLGVVSFVSIVSGGGFGTIIFGYIFDNVNNYKWITFFVLKANLLSSLGVATALSIGYRLGTFILIPIFGLFSGSLMVISYEYAIETTYPTPEIFGAAILNAVTYTVAIFYEILLSIIFDTLGYATGGAIIIISLTISTFAILFISTELRRKKANITNVVI